MHGDGCVGLMAGPGTLVSGWFALIAGIGRDNGGFMTTYDSEYQIVCMDWVTQGQAEQMRIALMTEY